MKFASTLTTFLILLTSLTTIKAQQFQPPPLPVPIGVATNNAYIQQPKRECTFTVNCPHCGGKFKGLHPYQIISNHSISTNGGFIIHRTISFVCPKLECGQKFDAENTKFVPAAIAVEDAPDGASASSPDQPLVVTDNPPTVSVDAIYNTSITNFTNRVAFQFVTHRSNLFGAPIPGPAFDVSFPVVSNNYYTAWYATNLSKAPWVEWQTPQTIHPARSNWIFSMFLPFLASGSGFYQIRSKNMDGTTSY